MTGSILTTLAALFLVQPHQPSRVQAGKEDASPLAITLQRMDVDLRVPTGFDGVYQISRADAFGRGQAMFMRVDGAVNAVFPRSVYSPSPMGTVIEVPPGTVFWIGPVPTAPAPLLRPVSDTFMDLSDSLLMTEEGTDFAVARPGVSRVNSLISDESYRRRRIEVLMNRACGG